MMEHARRRIDPGPDRERDRLVAGPQVLEQEGVVAGLDADDEMRAGRAQILQMGGVGGQAVFDDDDRQMGMLAAEMLEPTAGGIALAVVLGPATLYGGSSGTTVRGFDADASRCVLTRR
jgi:hypothetical protein